MAALSLCTVAMRRLPSRCKCSVLLPSGGVRTGIVAEVASNSIKCLLAVYLLAIIRAGRRLARLLRVM